MNNQSVLPIAFTEKEVIDTLLWKKSVVRLPILGQHADINRSVYKKDDILWVQEAWAMQQGIYWHKAWLVLDKDGRDQHGTVAPTKWKTPKSMPYEAARLFLCVTDVRIERLNDMTDIDFMQEGVDIDAINPTVNAAWYRFSVAWDQKLRATDRKRFGWAANPLVWVIEFNRLISEPISDYRNRR